MSSHTPQNPGNEPHDVNDDGAHPLSDAADAANAPNTPNTPDPGEETAEVPALHLRRIRSFVTRAGRVSTGQRRALDELSPQFVLPFAPTPLDWTATFGRSAARVLEIGFGMGATTAEIAARRPDDDFLGIE